MNFHELAPMEMRAVDAIPDGPGWLYEPKWDGFRCLAHRDGDDVALQSKAGQPLARYFPEVVAALRAAGADAFSLDGELVVPVGGAFSFDDLQQRIHPAASRVKKLSLEIPALYLVFDLLRRDDESLLDAPIETRRAALEALMPALGDPATIRLSPATRDRAVVLTWFERVGGALDGVIAKKLGVPYASGKRDAAVKIKQRRSADCVVGGFRLAKDSTDRVGSLLLGLYDDDGRLDHIGFSSAFPEAERGPLYARLAPYVASEPGTAGEAGFTGSAPDSGPSRWSRGEDRDRRYIKLRHELVAEVGYDQVTGGRIRHGARFVRWRPDKAPRQCTYEQLLVTGAFDALLS